MADPKVAEEVAEEEFKRFAESMYLDIDPKGMDDEDKKGLEAAKRTFVRAVMDGSLVVNEKGVPIFTPRMNEGAKPLTFNEPTGAVFIAMDGKKSGHDVARLYASLAELTGVNPSTFAKMAERDLRVCRSIFTLFFG